MNIKLHTPKSLKMGSGMGSLKHSKEDKQVVK